MFELQGAKFYLNGKDSDLTDNFRKKRVIINLSEKQRRANR